MIRSNIIDPPRTKYTVWSADELVGRVLLAVGVIEKNGGKAAEVTEEVDCPPSSLITTRKESKGIIIITAK